MAGASERSIMNQTVYRVLALRSVQCRGAMKNKSSVLTVLVLGCYFVACALGQSYTINTIAGIYPPGDSGAATAALLVSPANTAVDGNGNVYFADVGNNKIRKVTPSGQIVTIAGRAFPASAATLGRQRRPSSTILARWRWIRRGMCIFTTIITIGFARSLRTGSSPPSPEDRTGTREILPMDGRGKRTRTSLFADTSTLTNYVDKPLQILASKVQRQADCTACANCCRHSVVPVSKSEIENIASHLSIRTRCRWTGGDAPSTSWEVTRAEHRLPISGSLGATKARTSHSP